MKTPKTREKHRYGFTLVETAFALVVLTISIVSSFEVISYALSITTDARERMEDYSRLEHAGLLTVASGDIVAPSEGIALFAASCDVPISIDGGIQWAKFTNVVYKYKPGAGKTTKMKPPAFVIFISKTP